MGNVLATSEKSAGIPPLSAPPPAPYPTQPSIYTKDETKANAEKPLENPGTMDELHKKCKGLKIIYKILT